MYRTLYYGDAQIYYNEKQNLASDRLSHVNLGVWRTQQRPDAALYDTGNTLSFQSKHSV